jgi:hypothetical protein
VNPRPRKQVDAEVRVENFLFTWLMVALTPPMKTGFDEKILHTYLLYYSPV